MRVVFLGTPEWAVPSLEVLASSKLRPTLVVTQPPRRRDRRGEATPSPVASAAERLSIPTIAPESVRSRATLDRIARERPDALAVVAFGRILPPALLALARLGGVNMHFSLLPRWRGAAPVQWAIAEGDEETGVTTMTMVEALDAGPLHLQARVGIGAEERAPGLGSRLARLGAPLLRETLEWLARGDPPSRLQDEALATHARMLRPEDGWADWSAAAEVIERRIRGFDPWPGQAGTTPRGKVRILESRTGPRDAGSAEPGTVLGALGEACLIACGGGTVLEAVRVLPEGRKAVTGAEAIRGRALVPGERLTAAP